MEHIRDDDLHTGRQSRQWKVSINLLDVFQIIEDKTAEGFKGHLVVFKNLKISSRNEDRNPRTQE